MLVEGPNIVLTDKVRKVKKEDFKDDVGVCWKMTATQ